MSRYDEDDLEHLSPKREVVITEIDVGVWGWVTTIVKVLLASIPALIIAGLIIAAIVGGLTSGF